jgi:oxepin-CoA hydrolase/3-oxo-5,6-dehydrosuberyl-CoA semialdehyde dehydrogenase
MGPLATKAQLEAALAGLAELSRSARIVHGTGARADGAGSPAGKGWFLAPTLLRCDDAASAGAVHGREVFAPVATLLPYSGDAGEAAGIVARGGGTLVTSAYGDDAGWLAAFAAGVGPVTGRLYVGSEGSAADAPGSGIAMPQTLHGGPGRAGGGEELGGLVGVKLYLQRLALQGSRATVERLAGIGN